jgi:RNA polymerase sigma-70 factor (ECF subfamily)
VIAAGILAVTNEVQLEPAVVAALYAEHGGELRRFLWGVLRDEALAGDVLQATFVRLIEVGQKSHEETRKAWLFRVAYNEAMAIKRRERTGQRVLAQQALWQRIVDEKETTDPLVSQETVERVQTALQALPCEQADVVRMRIYEDKKFVEIAAELKIPLGTALARMRAALKKLRERL